MPCWDYLNWKCKIPFLVPGAFSVPIPPCIDIVQISKNIPQKNFLMQLSPMDQLRHGNLKPIEFRVDD